MSPVGATVAFAYSADELRLLCRLVGGVLPAMLLAGWAAEDAAVADVVAARGLLARGALRLAHTAGPPLVPTTPVQDLLAPACAPQGVIEVERIDAVGSRRRRAALVGPPGCLGLAEREPDVWEVTPHAEATLDTIDDAAESLASPEPPAAPDRPVSLPLPPAAYRTLDRPPPATAAEVVDALQVRGVPAGTARTLAPILAARRATTVIRTARRAGEARYELDELSWVEAGEQGVWRIDRGAFTAEHDGEAGTLVATTAACLHPDVVDLRAYIADVVGQATSTLETR